MTRAKKRRAVQSVSALEEREAILAWLRSGRCALTMARALADRIERGEHLQPYEVIP